MGVRTYGNNYSDKMKELWRQLSPRLSVSYRLIEGLTLSGHVGLYYQLPSYRVCQPSLGLHLRVTGKFGVVMDTQ